MLAMSAQAPASSTVILDHSCESNLNSDVTHLNDSRERGVVKSFNKSMGYGFMKMAIVEALL